MYWLGLFGGYFCLSFLTQIGILFFNGIRLARREKRSVTINPVPHFFLSILIGILLSIPHCVFLSK